MRNAAAADFKGALELALIQPRVFVAWLDGTIVGCIQSVPMHITANAQGFAWLLVHPQYRRRRIGRDLLAFAEAEVIARRFKTGPGTFLLVSECDPDYYLGAGYHGGGLLTHDGHPFMVKLYTGQAKTI